jgi:hypothetical protein
VILLHESKQGYPTHFWLAMGHLAEAGDELLRDYREVADNVRNERKLLEDDPLYEIPILDMIDQVTEIAERENTDERQADGDTAGHAEGGRTRRSSRRARKRS